VILADQAFADVNIAVRGEVARLAAPEETGAAVGDVQNAERLRGG